MFVTPRCTLLSVCASYTRQFSSYGLIQKTLVEKFQGSKRDPATLTLGESTRFFNRWLLTHYQTMINEYEEAILARIELPKDVTLQRAKVAGLHTLSFTNNTDKDDALISTPTVMLHGHASSGMFYHRNFKGLSQQIKNLYTVDLPDVALSDTFPPLYGKVTGKKLNKKPKYDLKVNAKTGEYRIRHDPGNKEIVETVKDYYLSAIENWRLAQGLEKINLVGHSFGGYLSFWYAHKYPERVKKLVLVSPAGVERSLFALDKDSQGGKTSLDGYTFGIVNNDITSNNYYRGAFIPWAISQFGFGLTKVLGPLGIQLISKYLSLRYERGVVLYNSKARRENKDTEANAGVDTSKVDQVDVKQVSHTNAGDSELLKLFVKYSTLLFYQNQKSYFLLQCLLNNQILAYDPLFNHVGRPKDDLKMDMMLMYGQYDWMNSEAGLKLALKHHSAGHGSVFQVVEDAGHNIFLDNSREFDANVLSFLRR